MTKEYKAYKIKEILFALLNIIFRVIYYAVGRFTANFDNNIPNLIFLLAFGFIEISLAYVEYKKQYDGLLVFKFIRDLLITVPYLYFFIDFALDGVITIFLQSVGQWENANAFYIIYGVISVVNTVLFVKMIKRGHL
ncbi:MAG: hypothetical protein PUE08_04480 [Eubacteriales bacterium]|nr:hypothetical protein [Eubacteriales bacterium]